MHIRLTMKLEEKLEKLFENSVVPVSYTHLDVYKRQMHTLTLVSTLMCLVFRLSANIAAFASLMILASHVTCILHVFVFSMITYNKHVVKSFLGGFLCSAKDCAQ